MRNVVSRRSNSSGQKHFRIPVRPWWAKTRRLAPDSTIAEERTKGGEADAYVRCSITYSPASSVAVDTSEGSKHTHTQRTGRGLLAHPAPLPVCSAHFQHNPSSPTYLLHRNITYGNLVIWRYNTVCLINILHGSSQVSMYWSGIYVAASRTGNDGAFG